MIDVPEVVVRDRRSKNSKKLNRENNRVRPSPRLRSLARLPLLLSFLLSFYPSFIHPKTTSFRLFHTRAWGAYKRPGLALAHSSGPQRDCATQDALRTRTSAIVNEKLIDASPSSSLPKTQLQGYSALSLASKNYRQPIDEIRMSTLVANSPPPIPTIHNNLYSAAPASPTFSPKTQAPAIQTDLSLKSNSEETKSLDVSSESPVHEPAPITLTSKDVSTSLRPAKDVASFLSLLPPAVEFVEGSSTGTFASELEGRYEPINASPKLASPASPSSEVSHQIYGTPSSCIDIRSCLLIAHLYVFLIITRRLIG